MARLDLSTFGKAQATRFNIQCPKCTMWGVFQGFADVLDATWHDGAWICGAGMRLCPNGDCRELVFVEYRDYELTQVYPPERIDFDAANLPENILASLNEAIACHSVGAFRASALMVRRVLEELCEERGATGKNLKQRLEALGSTIVIPASLMAAAEELRLLGNDAAHVEAQIYSEIGPAELELAIEMAKELLNATYQLDDLVSRLRALKGPS